MYGSANIASYTASSHEENIYEDPYATMASSGSENREMVRLSEAGAISHTNTTTTKRPTNSPPKQLPSLAEAIHPGMARVGVRAITSHVRERYILTPTSLPRHVQEEILRFFETEEVDDVTWERIVDDVGIRDSLPVPDEGNTHARAKCLMQVFPQVSGDWNKMARAFERNSAVAPAKTLMAWVESRPR